MPDKLGFTPEMMPEDVADKTALPTFDIKSMMSQIPELTDDVE